jgi:AraC-like DNA-binding protein
MLDEQIRVWRPPHVELVELHRGRRVTRRVPRHWHEEYQICLIQAGAGELFYRGVHHPNPSWSLFLVHPGEVHSNQATAQEGCDYRSMNAAPELLGRAASAVAGRRQGLPFFPSAVLVDADALGRFLRLHELLEGTASRLESDTALLETLAWLVARHSRHQPTPIRGGREPGAVARVREYLEAHYAEEVPLARLASLAGLSGYHLNRVFRLAIGLPPHAFQTQLRVVHARKLLRQGRAPAAVAAETGFADQSHFTRRFKAVVGVAPGAYRHRKNVQDRHGNGA